MGETRGGTDTERKTGMPATRRDPQVRRAMISVPRRLFLRAETEALTYDDRHLRPMQLQALWAPDALAALIEALEPAPGQRVLQVGAGSGYCAAILDRLGLDVFVIESSAAQAEAAARTLALAGCEKVRVRHAPAASGWAGTLRFDAILVCETGVQASASLKRQLADGGRLVLAQGARAARQTLLRIRCAGDDAFVEEKLGDLALVRRLGDILVEFGAATREQIDRAAGEAAASGKRLGDVLQDKTKVPENVVYRALAAQKGMKFGTLDSLIRHVDLRVVQSVPRSFLDHNRFLPIAALDGRVTVATCELCPNVADLGKVFDLRDVEVCLVTPSDYRRLWASVDMMLAGHGNVQVEPEPTEVADDLMAEVQGADEAHFVSLFDMMILESIGERASDIHLERYGERVRVRVRVDGDLRDLDRFRMSPPELMGLVNVIKIRAGLDIAEHRLPQGGRMRIRGGGKSYDVRVQTQPALYGEHAVLRILPQDVKLLSIEDLGYPSEIARAYRRLLDEPSGLVLVVGPTGSGKTTSLYAALQVVARDPTRKVLTIEDPIEYSIDGVQQTQVRREIRFGFADAMRAFLREDPDVILVGEIRDHETALEAMRAAQTGHLVFSTLHCSDATDAVQRLIDLELHPNTIGSELLAVIPQRLARRVCDECRAPEPQDAALLREVFPDGAPPEFRSFRGAGCARCAGFGTFGRIACVEFLRVNGEVRDAISRGLTVQRLREVALRSGLLPMRDSALSLVQRGLIPLRELREILSSDRLGGGGP